MADGSIIIDTLLDPHGLEKGLGSIDKIATKGLKIFSGAVAAAGTALTGLGLAGIKVASDLTEVQNVVDVTFGKNAGIINDWAKNAATAFGMSELQAKKFNGTMGAMLKSMGLNDTQVLDLSTSMTGLSADFASFYNLEHEEAFDKIRSGISGETEPLKQLGINMSVANLEAFALAQGIKKPYKEMSQAEQTLLRYNYLMGVSADAQGDFARTSDSLANQMRVAKLNMNSLLADLGKLLLPIATEAVKAFNEFGKELQAAFNDPKVQESIVKIAEGIGSVISGVAELVSDLLPKVIDAFAWVCDNTDSIGLLTAAILGTVGAVKALMIIETLNKLWTAYKAGTIGAQLAQLGLNAAMWANPMTWIVAAIGALVAAVIYLWNTNEDFRNFWIGVWDSIATFFSDCWNGIMTFFTETIPAWIDGVIEWFEGIPAWFSELPYKIGYAVGEALAALLQWGIDCYNWVTTEIPKIIDSIGTWFSELPGRISQWFDESITELTQWGSDMYNSACTAVNDTVDGIGEWFSELPNNLANIGRNLVEGLWNGITGAKDWLMDKVSGFCDGVLDGFLGFFDIHSPSRVFRDMIGTNLVKGIGVGVDVEMPNLMDQVDGNVEDLTAKLKGTVDYETAKTTAGVLAQNNIGTSTNSGASDENRVIIGLLKQLADKDPNLYVNGREVANVMVDDIDGALYNKKISNRIGMGK